MDTFIDLGWRIYPAAAVMALGALAMLQGLRLEVAGFKSFSGKDPNLVVLVRGFRLFVAGAAVVGLGAAWAWHVPGLLVLSLVIGGEEAWRCRWSYGRFEEGNGWRRPGPPPSHRHAQRDDAYFTTTLTRRPGTYMVLSTRLSLT